jgi:glutamine amidotransferase
MGAETLLDNLLFKPNNSLVKQVYMPKMLSMLNLAGFGMKAWGRNSESPAVPYSYSTDRLPVFDQNLKSLAEKVRVNCLLAHVRGVPSTTESMVSQNNNHPFCFPGHKISFAHNGDFSQFGKMKALLIQHIDPLMLEHIAGTTDSEWVYALLLSQLEDSTDYIHPDELKQAVEKTLRIIRDLRARCGINTSSSANLFISDGRHIIAVRYCFNFGHYPLDHPASVADHHLNYLSLWYTLGREYGQYQGEWQTIGGSGRADTVIIASEPLTRDTSTWLEVPEYSMLCVDTCNGTPRISLDYLNV